MNSTDEFIFKLCATYDIAMFIKTPEGDKDMNPMVAAAYSWVNENVKMEELEEFFKQVTSNFRRTNAAKFPMPKELKEIYNSDASYFYPEYKPERIGPDNQITMDAAVKEIDYAPFDMPPETSEKFSLEKLVFDANSLPEKMLMQKYGVKICGQYWRAQGVWAAVHGYEIKNLGTRNFKLSDIEKYFNEV